MSKSNYVFGVISAMGLAEAFGYLKERYFWAEQINVLEQTIQDKPGDVQEFLVWGDL